MSDHDEDQPVFGPMSLEQFMRMIGAHAHQQSDEDEHEERVANESIERSHNAIHNAIQAEYKALCERAKMTDALRDQPDLAVETAGRGYALHFLGARMAGVLAKHIGNGPKQEWEAQRLEHLAQLQRWIPVVARTSLAGENIDQVLAWLAKNEDK